LHEKHPVFKKLNQETLKRLLRESAVVSLVVGQTLYDFDQNDKNVYFVLFGKVSLYSRQQGESRLIGKVSLGWTLGEEILYNSSMKKRQEQAVCTKEACLIGIESSRLSSMQADLLIDKN
jgi:signal-transduction protein with cAMP-binding, CBS, and nucleotidyltransferase domain